MKHTKGNLLNALSEDAPIQCDYIAHVCNAQGKYSAGLAKQIRAAYPSAYKAYIDAYERYGSEGMLGKVIMAKYSPVLNMVAQRFYGRDGKRYLDYGYLLECLLKVQLHFCSSGGKVGIPEYLGCGLAGGDWDVVQEIVQGVERVGDVEFIVYEM